MHSEVLAGLSNPPGLLFATICHSDGSKILAGKKASPSAAERSLGVEDHSSPTQDGYRCPYVKTSKNKCNNYPETRERLSDEDRLRGDDGEEGAGRGHG